MREVDSPVSVAELASLSRRHAALTWLVSITREPAALAALRAELADVDRNLAVIDALIASSSTAPPAGASPIQAGTKP